MHINFKPPVSVIKAAKRGLGLRKRFGRGGLSSRQAGKLGIGSGIVRAVTIARGFRLSPRTVKRMRRYFIRHKRDKHTGWSNKRNPSNGYIAWLLWGGDAGRRWANKTVRQMGRADRKND